MLLRSYEHNENHLFQFCFKEFGIRNWSESKLNSNFIIPIRNLMNNRFDDVRTQRKMHMTIELNWREAKKPILNEILCKCFEKQTQYVIEQRPISIVSSLSLTLLVFPFVSSSSFVRNKMKFWITNWANQITILQTREFYLVRQFTLYFHFSHDMLLLLKPFVNSQKLTSILILT